MIAKYGLVVVFERIRCTHHDDIICIRTRGITPIIVFYPASRYHPQVLHWWMMLTRRCVERIDGCLIQLAVL